MYKAIVWSADGSQHAERALPHVKELAKAEGATITIVHVVERIEGGGAVGVPRRADEREVQAKLQDLAAGLSQEGFSVSLIVRGDVGAQEQAAREGRIGSGHARSDPRSRPGVFCCAAETSGGCTPASWRRRGTPPTW